jgi:NADH/F420H2 dehydrogenase subunit C
MTHEQIKEKIFSIVPEAAETANKQYPTFVVPAEKFHSLCEKIKQSENLSFDYLFCLSGMDWGDTLGVVYHLFSTKHEHYVVLKVKTTERNNPEFDTICDLWKTAEFHEREVFDLFGIKFKNHPDLRRIFLEEDWKGHPLRKDYVDEINIVER